jgi:hypothetical protein
MSSVSPQLVLGFCILGTGVATVVGYSLSRLFRKKELNEHEESVQMTTNPFHDMSREQQEYMAQVRGRTTEALWESLQMELRKERERQSATMGIGEGGGGGGGCYLVGLDHGGLPPLFFCSGPRGGVWVAEPAG